MISNKTKQKSARSVPELKNPLFCRYKKAVKKPDQVYLGIFLVSDICTSTVQNYLLVLCTWKNNNFKIPTSSLNWNILIFKKSVTENVLNLAIFPSKF